MKIYTSSYFETELHGPGRKIGISPSKPKNLEYECDICHEYLSPENVYWDYHKAKKAAGEDEALVKKAGENFVVNYVNRLAEFKADLEKESKATGQSIQDLIGLEDGDTLLSWEHSGHLTFRTHTAEFLRELGYDVEER
jgi:hypothetical protein